TTQVINDIEVPRVETVTSKLESLLIFLKRTVLNYGLYGVVALGGFLLLRGIIELTGLDFLNNQFLFMLYAGGILTFGLHRAYKVLIDEQLTYWSWKRDGAIMAFLAVCYIVPPLIYKDKLRESFSSGKSPYFEAIDQNNIALVKKLHGEGHAL